MMNSQNIQLINLTNLYNNQALQTCSNYYLPNLRVKKYNLLKIKQLVEHKQKQIKMNQFRKTTQHPQIIIRHTTLCRSMEYKAMRASQPKLHPAFMASCSKNRRIFDFWKIKSEKKQKSQKQNRQLPKPELGTIRCNSQSK